jgi:hypothetical protein
MHFCCMHFVLVYIEIMCLTLLFATDQTLFRSMCSSDHCLDSILPAIKTRHCVLQDHDYELVLPEFGTVFF